MQVIETEFNDVKILVFKRKQDARGVTQVTLDYSEMANQGMDFTCKEQRVYHAPRNGTFYGIHFQGKKHPQAKLIHILAGRGIDYIVDLRKESPSYSQWISIELQEGDNQHVFIPQGFGHAFLSMEDNTTLLFSVNEHFDSHASMQIRFDDKQINLSLPIPIKAMADYDRDAPYLHELEFEV